MRFPGTHVINCLLSVSAKSSKRQVVRHTNEPSVLKQLHVNIYSTILNGQICTDNSNIKLIINIIPAQTMQWTFMFSGDV